VDPSPDPSSELAASLGDNHDRVNLSKKYDYPSFKNAWAKARHCIVPCEAIYEPDWRSGTHIPTRFTAANDETLGVAGLWRRGAIR
jgi:putative SOS response-associated peptidase YedK